jgi:hypothetical protein
VKAILFSLPILFLSAESNASEITLINNSSDSSAVEFQLYQGNNRVARVGVQANGKAEVPTTSSYTAQASTTMGDVEVVSNPVTVSDPSVTLLAQVLVENGYYDFKLVPMSGISPNSVNLENTLPSPVQFKLTRPNTPVQIVTIVDEHNHGSLSAGDPYTAYAVVNGKQTQSVQITDPNATVTLKPNNNDDAFSLVVSFTSSPKSTPYTACVLNQTPIDLAIRFHMTGTVAEDIAVPSREDVCGYLPAASGAYEVELGEIAGKVKDDSCQHLKLKGDHWVAVSLDKSGRLVCRIGSD